MGGDSDEGPPRGCAFGVICVLQLPHHQTDQDITISRLRAGNIVLAVFCHRDGVNFHLAVFRCCPKQ